MKVCVSVPLTLMTWACIVTLTFIVLFHVSHAFKLRPSCLIYDFVCRCVSTHEVKWSCGVHGQGLQDKVRIVPVCAVFSLPFSQLALLWHHVQTKRSDDIHEAVSDGFTALIRQLIKRLLLPLSADLI